VSVLKNKSGSSTGRSPDGGRVTRNRTFKT